MDTPGWERRVGPIAGILFILVALAGSFSAGNFPSVNAPAPEIVAYYAAHRTAIFVGAYLNCLALLPFVLFAAALYIRLRPASGVLPLAAFAGGLIGGTLVQGSDALGATLAYLGGDADAATARGLHLGTAVTGQISWIPLGIFPLCASVVMLRMGGASRWIGALGVLAGLLYLVAAASYARHGPFALGSLGGVLPFLLFLIWILATSIAMLRRPHGWPDDRPEVATAGM